METVTLYLEIGKRLHNMGVYRVVFLNSKATPDEHYIMGLEIAVDGSIDVKKASVGCNSKWPNILIKLLDLNDFENLEFRKIIDSTNSRLFEVA